jgi:DNA-damage-inducible protein D
MISATEIGLDLQEHFFETEKTVKQGRATRPITEYFLSKRACYLVAQNGDPHKSQIAAAQNYFAFTAEVFDMQQARLEQEQRLQLRLKLRPPRHKCAGVPVAHPTFPCSPSGKQGSWWG